MPPDIPHCERERQALRDPVRMDPFPRVAKIDHEALSAVSSTENANREKEGGGGCGALVFPGSCSSEPDLVW